jgi:nitrite reductase (NADH) small subunit
MSAAESTYPLGRLDEIPLGEGRVFRVEGQEIVVYRCRSGEVYASSAECPHRGGPLADGLVGNHSVICPLHGFQFDLRTGEASGRDCGRLVTHRIVVSDGELLLELP